jgi:hypothetical protein
MSMNTKQAAAHTVRLSDLPELTPWLEQHELKQQLLAQSGGGEAFIALATPMLKRHLLSVDPQQRLQGERSQLKTLLRRRYTHDEIARAFAAAWLQGADQLELPRRGLSEKALVVYGLPLLVLGSVLITVALVAFEAHPRWMGPFIYLAPLFMLIVVPVFLLLLSLWRKLLRGTDAVRLHRGPGVVDLRPLDSDADAPQPSTLSLTAQPGKPLTAIASDGAAPNHHLPAPGETSDPAAALPTAVYTTTQAPPPNQETPAMAEPQQTLTIDGTEYPLTDLSEAAQQQVMNLRLCDQELQRLQQQLAIAQTARAAYANALKAELPKAVAH